MVMKVMARFVKILTNVHPLISHMTVMTTPHALTSMNVLILLLTTVIQIQLRELVSTLTKDTNVVVKMDSFSKKINLANVLISTNVLKVVTIVLKILMVVSVPIPLVHFLVNVLKDGPVTVPLTVTDVSTMTNVTLEPIRVMITLSVVILVVLLNVNVMMDGLVMGLHVKMLTNALQSILTAVILLPHVSTMMVLMNANVLMVIPSINSQINAMMLMNVQTMQATVILTTMLLVKTLKDPSPVFVLLVLAVQVLSMIPARKSLVNVIHLLLK